MSSAKVVKGALRSLNLEEWFNKLPLEYQEKVRKYSAFGDSLFEGDFTVENHYTQKHFISDIASKASGLHQEYEDAVFFAKEGLLMEGDSQGQLSLYDMLIKAFFNLQMFERVEEYSLKEIDEFPQISEDLKRFYKKPLEKLYISCRDGFLDSMKIRNTPKSKYATILRLFVQKKLFTQSEANERLESY